MSEATYDVVWPLGRTRGEIAELPGRLDTLEGKVVAELWDWVYEGDRAFPILRDELARRFPGISFVDYTHFGNIHGGDEHAVIERLPELLREHGVDAVIAGVGH
jgi:hypothetical protein